MQVAEPLQYAYLRNSGLADGTVEPSAPLPTAVLDAPTALPPTAVPLTPIPTVAASATAIAAGVSTVVVDKFSGSASADAPTPLRSFSFQETETPATTATAGWLLLSGTWSVQNGVYSQLDAEGYDYITLLDLPKQRHYSIEVRMRMRSGEMGGGLIYNAPSQESRAGAQIIDVDERGRYLRWGYYDAAGLYTFTGGVTLDAGLADSDWHRLRLVTQENNSIIWFDDQEVGRTVNQSIEGYLGLVASRAQIDFDDLVVIALPPENLSVVP